MSDWTKIRDTAETAAVLIGNYYFPGSSMVTSHLVSDGSQEQLNSKEGKLLQLGTGGTGVLEGNLANWTGGGEGGLKLPSFAIGGNAGAPVEAPAPTGGVDWANAPDQSAAETSRLMRQDATANGVPVDNSGIDWGAKAENYAKQKAIETGVNQALGGNRQQQQQADDGAPQNMDINGPDKTQEQRRQALMQKASELRQRISELRARIAQEESVQQQIGQAA